MQDSIFTRIIKGEIPCQKIYEDESTIAFLDIDPLLPGHVLVVPKQQIDHVYDLPDSEYDALMKTVKKVARRVKDVLGTERAVLLVMGYDVPHAHVHVIPADRGHDVYAAMAERLNADRQTPEPDFTSLSAIAKKLMF